MLVLFDVLKLILHSGHGKCWLSYVEQIILKVKHEVKRDKETSEESRLSLLCFCQYEWSRSPDTNCIQADTELPEVHGIG